MTISQKELARNIQLISVDGRLDQSQTAELTTRLNTLLEKHAASQPIRFIVDLNQTTYINSGGLRCLVTAWRKARERDGDLVITGLNDRLNDVFTMVGFDKVFQIYDSVAAALEAEGQGPAA